MADENWYPGKNLVAWGKKTVKDHPRAAGAVAVGGTIAAIVGTGGVAAIGLVLVGVGTGASLGGALSQDAKDKEEKK